MGISYAEALGAAAGDEVSYAAAGTDGGTATYIDAAGDRQTGVVGSETEQLTHWQQMERYYKSLYDSQVEANNSAAATATAQTLTLIQSQIDALNSQYRQTDRQLYRDYMESRRELPQELAAKGYTGGLSESGRLRLDTGYQESLAGNERARLGDIAGLNAQGAQAQQSNAAAADKANAAAQSEYYGYLTSLSSDEYADRQTRAEAMASAGDFSGYEALGYSAEEVTRLRDAWEAANPELDLAVKARENYYSAADVSAMAPALAQQYLNALGYAVDVNGAWNWETENAFRQAFGGASGRYSSGAAYYGYAAAAKEEKSGMTFGKGRRSRKQPATKTAGVQAMPV